MTENQHNEITAAADVAWAAYTDAIQAVQLASSDETVAELERLWLAAELAAQRVRLMCMEVAG